MVIARGDVRDDRAEHIERCAVAQRFLNLHVRRDLIERHMAGTLDHDLHVFFPRALGQLAERDEFFNLRSVGRVLQAAGAACIAETERHVIFTANVENFVKILEERVLLAGHFHPCKNDGAAAGNDVHQTAVAFKLLRRLFIDAAVDGHEVYTVLRMHAHNVNPLARSDFAERLVVVNDRVIDRHGADHRRTLVRQLAAELLRIAEGAEVHNGLRAHFDRMIYFFKLHVKVGEVAGRAEIDVDLRLQHGAEAVRLYACMHLIARDDNLALRHERHEFFRLQMLFFGNFRHFRRKNALAGGIHLRCVFHFLFLS